MVALAVSLASVACAYSRAERLSLNQALCVAASQGNTAAVVTLLKRGADPNAVGVVPASNCGSDSDPLHALGLAVTDAAAGCGEQVGPHWTEFRRDNRETVAVLLRAGADVNARDQDGYTALMLAHSPRMIKFLVAHGAKETRLNRSSTQQ